MNRDLELRVRRDEAAAEIVRSEAAAALRAPNIRIGSIDPRTGLTQAQIERLAWGDDRRRSLACMTTAPFHAVMEVVTEISGDNDASEEKAQLWYASENSTTNEAFRVGVDRISVLSWSHPGVQLALSGQLHEWCDISARGYRLTGLQTNARARFDMVAPRISGLYEPGGPVRPTAKPVAAVGLKAVKLSMTVDQVNAFISRMTGLMIVTGAPGSGKTTVALQRIRFLLDQQNLRTDPRAAPFTVARTRVFLANPNLVAYSRRMLVEQLDIPDDVVALVDPFIDELLSWLWAHTHQARPRQQRLSPLEQQARRAYFGLCRVEMLEALWRAYERQISERLAALSQAWWADVDMPAGARVLCGRLVGALVAYAGRARGNGDPVSSAVRLDRLYAEVARPYEAVREALTGPARAAFDEAFQRALFHIYDPLSALATAFGPERMEGAGRIARGTGHRAREAEVLDSIEDDWTARRYGPEEQAWLAWLLRFALSEVQDAQGQGRFRMMPGALDCAGGQQARWTHVALDEAQDLSVVEASLLASFVQSDGAITVSADFRQAVTPVKGMEDASALSVGSPLRDGRARTIFRFGRNMRQSKQIGWFLQGFHEAAFGELAPFDVNVDLSDTKPRLMLVPQDDQPRRIAQLLNALRRSDILKSIAILQINEQEETLLRLRAALEALGATLAPPFEAVRQAGVVTTSVERIKGLEFDACIVLGLEDAERSTLNFTLNRAYVGLSRPARRLAMICEHTPSVLRKMDSSLFDVVSQ